MSSRFTHTLAGSPSACLAVSLLLILQAPQYGLADRWEMPRTRRVLSHTRKFVAIVTPAHEADKPVKERPRVSVHRAREDGAPDGQALWSSPLTNSVSPVSVLVTGDGQHVVTFNDWYREGYGLNVLAFYGAQGQSKRYSLEDLL